jgi:hypothetical protein
MKERSNTVGARHAIETAGEKASPIPAQFPFSNAAWVEASLMVSSENILERL